MNIFNHLLPFFYYSGISIVAFFTFYYLYLYFKYSDFVRSDGKHFYWKDAPSVANPITDRNKKYGYLDGFLYTKPSVLKKRSIKAKNAKFPLRLNRFKYEKQYLEETRMPNFIKNKAEKIEHIIDSKDLDKGLYLVAGAGSGKTVMIRNLMEQTISKRQLFLSVKGEFEGLYFREGIDILLNVNHPAGVVHDILSEPIVMIKIYVNTLLSDKIGDKKDFFTGKSQDMINAWLERIKVNEHDNKLSIQEKWKEFIDLIEKESEEIENGDRGSEKDVLSTAEISIPLLKLSAYRIKNGARTFTVKDFTDNENIRLFLSTTSTETIPFLSATFAVLVRHMLNMPNIEEYDPDNLTTFFLDEYLTLVRSIDPEILNEITEKGRSKGLQKIAAGQKLGDDKKEIESMLTNIEYIIVGSLTHQESIDALQKLIGEVSYMYEKKSTSYNAGKKSDSFSIDEKKTTVLSDYLIKTIRNQDYSSLTLIPKQEIIYMSQFDRISERKRDFDIDLKIDDIGFYKYKQELEDKRKGNKAAIDSLSKNFKSR